MPYLKNWATDRDSRIRWLYLIEERIQLVDPKAQSITLIEHFFRHEYGRLVASLTRLLGVRHLELVEDVVQSAISKALQSWSLRGTPDDPHRWLFRTSYHLAIDHLRREGNFARNQDQFAVGSSDFRSSSSHLFEEHVQDNTLKMLFLCCQDSIPKESQIAFALKMVGGFSISEIARGFYVSDSSVEKRISRAKQKLKEVGEELVDLSLNRIEERLSCVQLTIYLLFNEGYASSTGDSPIRRELCEEAIRLARMLIDQESCNVPSTKALLSLMLFHAARLDLRVDQNQSIVLLEHQDRSAWNWEMIREAMYWMLQSADGSHLSRYHVEAAIAWEHSRTSSFDSTDWTRILELYRILESIAPSPMVRLNRAVATMYGCGLREGMSELLSIPPETRSQLRPWWDCAVAINYFRLGEIDHARSHWIDAKQLATTLAQRRLIEEHLRRISE